jgi:selenocysteine-specific translation elongation factor
MRCGASIEAEDSNVIHMKNIVVAILNDQELAGYIGKKGSSNGVAFYNRKAPEATITALAPTDFEGKPYAVAQAMLMADIIVVSTKNVDSAFGESIVGGTLLGKEILLTDENDVAKIVSNLDAKAVRTVGREELLRSIEGYDKSVDMKGIRVVIDRAFPVKGIGTVLLGIVRSGVLKKHGILFNSSGKGISVRSLQAQDVDIDSADPGTRVGISVKGVESDDIDKGEVLSDTPVKRVAEIRAEVTISPAVKGVSLDSGDFTLVSDFSATAAKIKGVQGQYTITLEKPLPVCGGDAFLLVRRSKPRIFAVGKVLS